MKKRLFVLLLALSVIAGCGSGTSSQGQSGSAGSFDSNKPITVISREDGSGTRGAFIELFGIEKKDADGKKIDYTTDEAVITNSTSVMLTGVANNVYAIGYVSLGSLNDTVKALKIDGAAATAENIEVGTYKIARPFNIAVRKDLNDTARDFVAFILSDEGQAVVESSGYIAVDSTGPFASAQSSGKVVIAGSSSVTPVMEKLKEAYNVVNPNATIEIQQSDSTTGMNAVIDGICDIGMASRALKDSELVKGIEATVVAIDGIAVIANLANAADGLTSDEVFNIFTGEAATWQAVFN